MHTDSHKTCVVYSEEGMREYLRNNGSTDNLCLHVTSTPTCPIGDEPVLLKTDGLLYDKEWLQEFLKQTSQLNPDNLIPVSIATSEEMISKLDTRKKLLRGEAIIFIGRKNNNDDEALVMIEKQDTHGTGIITIYQFRREQSNSDKAILHQENFSGLGYSNTTTRFLLSQYNIDAKQLKVRTFLCATDQLRQVEETIHNDEQRIINGTYRYAYRSEKFIVNLFSVFRRVSFYNSCTWGRSLLQRTGVLNTPGINFDRDYRVRKVEFNSTRAFFLGATPDSVLPTLKERDNSQGQSPRPYV